MLSFGLHCVCLRITSTSRLLDARYLHSLVYWKSCLLWAGLRKLHSMTPTPPLRPEPCQTWRQCDVLKGRRGTTLVVCWMLNTGVRFLHLQLAAHFLIGLDEAVHVVHHHAVVLLLFGDEPKSHFQLVFLKIPCQGRQTTVASKQRACKQWDPWKPQSKI